MKTLILGSIALARDFKLLALHLAGNALLFTGVALWLIIPDKHAAQLVLTALSAVLLLLVALYLHAGTLYYAADATGTLRERFFRGFRHSMAFLVVVLFLLFLRGWIDGWESKMYQISGYVFSKAPAFVRGAIGPDAFESISSWTTSILAWYLVPAVLLPFAAAAARYGFGLELLKTPLRALKNWRYWLWLAVLEIPGIFLPSLLIDFVRHGSLAFESASMLARFGLAYLLAVVSWLAVAGMLGRLVAPAADFKGGAVGQPVP